MIKLQDRLDARDRARIGRATDTAVRVWGIHQILTGALMFAGHYNHVYELPTAELGGVLGSDIITFRLLWGPVVKVTDTITDITSDSH